VVTQVDAASRLAPRAMTCSRFSGARGALCTRVGAAAAGLLSSSAPTAEPAALYDDGRDGASRPVRDLSQSGSTILRLHPITEGRAP
jgi:hypothetical protein